MRASGVPADSNVRVMARVRLFNQTEKEESERTGVPLRPCIRMRDNVVTVVETVRDSSGRVVEREKDAGFQFDEAFWSMPADQFPCLLEYASQEMVYNKSGKLALHAALTGYNVCIFAYGQTGSGKTYSMLGSDSDPGISPRLVDELFATATRSPAVKCLVELSFFEIYNEKCRDLFVKKGPRDEYAEPKIRHHPTKGVFVEGLKRMTVTDATTTKKLIARGINERTTASTDMNAASSRSHAIFQLTVTQLDGLSGTQRVSVINLVDLAGSERTDRSNVVGEQLKQANYINLSLSTLRRVIDTLIENSGRSKKQQQLPPYRDSVLTRVLSDSLGGNSKTQMIATLSPHASNLEESVSSLRYALRARAIVCNAKVNEEKSDAVIQAMKEELLRLQTVYQQGVRSGSLIPDEAKAELEEKAAELQKMEVTTQAMKALLDQAKQNEGQLSAKLVTLQEQHELIAMTVQAQRATKFADAFRNAFRLGGERTRARELEEEVHRLRGTVTTLVEESRALKVAMDAAAARSDGELRTAEHRVTEVLSDVEKRDALIAKLRLLNAAAEESSAAAARDLLTSQSRNAERERAHRELEKALHYAQQEVFTARAEAQSSSAELHKTTATYEARLTAVGAELEEARKRKEHYKLLYLRTSTKAQASDAAVSALQSDRSAFVDALKCQQMIVREHSDSVHRALEDRNASAVRVELLEARVRRQDEEIAGLKEALREYQAAAADWSYESHRANAEIRNLSLAHAELRARMPGEVESPEAFRTSGARSSPELRPQRRSVSAKRVSPPTSRRV